MHENILLISEVEGDKEIFSNILGKEKYVITQLPFNSDAENSGPYSPEEDLVVLDPNLSAKEMALKLDRTLNSVRGRLRKLRKIQKEKEALEDGKGL